MAAAACLRWWIVLSPTFISHSYDDEDLPPLVRAKLPPPAELVIFPPVKVAPDETISGRLLERILACRSLVWIHTKNVRGSPVVTLERDYARRAGVDWTLARFDIVSVIASHPPRIDFFPDAFEPRRTL